VSGQPAGGGVPGGGLTGGGLTGGGLTGGGLTGGGFTGGGLPPVPEMIMSALQGQGSKQACDNRTVSKNMTESSSMEVCKLQQQYADSNGMHSWSWEVCAYVRMQGKFVNQVNVQLLDSWQANGQSSRSCVFSATATVGPQCHKPAGLTNFGKFQSLCRSLAQLPPR
jgi:hypothetical protein